MNIINILKNCTLLIVIFCSCNTTLTNQHKKCNPFGKVSKIIERKYDTKTSFDNYEKANLIEQKEYIYDINKNQTMEVYIIAGEISYKNISEFLPNSDKVSRYSSYGPNNEIEFVTKTTYFENDRFEEITYDKDGIEGNMVSQEKGKENSRIRKYYKFGQLKSLSNLTYNNDKKIILIESETNGKITSTEQNRYENGALISTETKKDIPQKNSINLKIYTKTEYINDKLGNTINIKIFDLEKIIYSADIIYQNFDKENNWTKKIVVPKVNLNNINLKPEIFEREIQYFNK